MKYLLDKHIAIWALVKYKRIPKEVIKLLSNPDNQVYYSTASIWETEIKHIKKPDKIKISGKQLATMLDDARAINLAVKNKHIYELCSLKKIEPSIEHNDPFDKLLLSQAISENMILITADKKFENYDCSNLMLI